MCDLTEVIYSPNDVVWVKLGPVWWPGRVCGEEEIPPEIMKDLRKTPIAIVKFFQEDSFEYVKSLSNIYHYHCPRKNEFIKKGLDMLRSKNRGAPSNMKLFPEDVVHAESLTNGNPAILQSSDFLPEERPAYTDLFASAKKPPKKVKPEMKRKSTPASQSTPSPRLITHPRFLQLSSGQCTDYEARERQQPQVRAECDQEDTASATTYSCADCGYTTGRLNVMVWHNKSHTRNYAFTSMSVKATKRKSAPAAVKLKERASGGASPCYPPLADDTETVSATKIPKTNGHLKMARLPKTSGRKKGSFAATKKALTPPVTETISATTTPQTSAPKGRRGSGHKTDEIHKSLLEDWLEDDADLEETEADELSSAGQGVGENTALANGSATGNNVESKSCFDFDDSEDGLVIDETKFKPGRKIPRLLSKSSASTLAADDMDAMQDSMGIVDVDASPAKYQSGVEDSLESESSLSHCTTSQLQEMGVDNEIEVNTEDVVIESIPPKKSRRTSKTEKNVNDAAELHDRVDKLLNEISKAPVKLPDIPRSHKKVQLKAYQLQAEAEEQAAHKAAAEAEAARIAAAEEAEATGIATAEAKATAVVEAAHIAVAKAEATRIAAAEAEAARIAAAEAKAAAVVEAARIAVAKAEATRIAAAEAEAARIAAAEAKAAAVVEAARIAVAEAETARIAAAEAEAVKKATAEAEATQRAAAEKEALPVAAKQQITSDRETAETIPQLSEVEEKIYDLHPEMMDIEVSSIPLPSPQKCPVTNEPVESSINIGASVTVENETSDEPWPITSPPKTESETLAAKNIVTLASSANSAPIDQNVATASSSLHSQLSASVGSTAKTGSVPATDSAKIPIKFSIASKTTKALNATTLLQGGQQTVKFISQSDYKQLLSKLNASISQASPGKTSDEPPRPIKTTIKMASGKSLVCNLAQPKVLLANSQSSGSPNKILILNCKQTSSASATSTRAPTTATTTSSLPAGRYLNLTNTTTLRVTPNILQKSPAAAQKAAAALAKSSGKNIVLDASTFQSLFQTQPQQLRKVQSQVVLPEVASPVKSQPLSSASMSAAPSQSRILLVAEGGAPVTSLSSDCASTTIGSAAGQTIDYNYIVDSSGNLVQVDEPPTAHPPTKDILAKALEDTDGLQTEMALSEAVTNRVLDTSNVTQNTDMAYKTEAIYENVALNTAPIMSAYESPSRAVAPVDVFTEATSEMANSNGEYLI